MATVAGPVKIAQRGKSAAVPASGVSGTAAKTEPTPPALRLRVIIRRLPASMTREEFNALVKDVINEATCDNIDFIAGKLPSDKNKETTFARAYFRAKSPEHLVAARNALHNRALTDARGQESSILVEYAPFQRVARKGGKIRVDSRTGTIDDDAEFKAFVENLRMTSGKPTKMATTSSVEANEASTSDVKDKGTEARVETERKTYTDPMAIQEMDYDIPLNAGGKATTTPIVEAIRQKKATPQHAKGKGVANEDDNKMGAKNGPRGGRGSTKRERQNKVIISSTNKNTTGGSKEVAKPKEKLVQTQTAGGQSSSTGKEKEKQIATPTGPTNTNPPRGPKGRRGPGAAASIIQRDLGLGPRERRRKDAETTAKNIDKDKTGIHAPSAGTSTDPASELVTDKQTPAADTTTTQPASSASTLQKLAQARKHNGSANSQPSTHTGPANNNNNINPRAGRNPRNRQDRNQANRDSASQGSTAGTESSTDTTAVPSSANSDTPAIAASNPSPPTGPRNNNNNRNFPRNRDRNNRQQQQQQNGPVAGTSTSASVPASTAAAPSPTAAAPPTGPKAMQNQNQSQNLRTARGPAASNTAGGSGAGDNGVINGGNKRRSNRGGRRQGGGGGGGTPAINAGAASASASAPVPAPVSNPTT